MTKIARLAAFTKHVAKVHKAFSIILPILAVFMTIETIIKLPKLKTLSIVISFIILSPTTNRIRGRCACLQVRRKEA